VIDECRTGFCKSFGVNFGFFAAEGGSTGSRGLRFKRFNKFNTLVTKEQSPQNPPLWGSWRGPAS
jgi:hypothetical protein